jgi:hypothetical protein
MHEIESATVYEVSILYGAQKNEVVTESLNSNAQMHLQH